MVAWLLLLQLWPVEFLPVIVIVLSLGHCLTGWTPVPATQKQKKRSSLFWDLCLLWQMYEGRGEREKRRGKAVAQLHTAPELELIDVM